MPTSICYVNRYKYAYKEMRTCINVILTAGDMHINIIMLLYCSAAFMKTNNNIIIFLQSIFNDFLFKKLFMENIIIVD